MSSNLQVRPVITTRFGAPYSRHFAFYGVSGGRQRMGIRPVDDGGCTMCIRRKSLDVRWTLAVRLYYWNDVGIAAQLFEGFFNVEIWGNNREEKKELARMGAKLKRYKESRRLASRQGDVPGHVQSAKMAVSAKPCNFGANAIFFGSIPSKSTGSLTRNGGAEGTELVLVLDQSVDSLPLALWRPKRTTKTTTHYGGDEAWEYGGDDSEEY
ncbi:hypothetical protein B0H17DRAFT_1130339 [Mycena rosella]|uniref:Uncharacterized protein n=1 Tax=Mycena rosella TaxID=1033263 RepID=A0AAD7DRG0_MYCRO|nr:hypothetical protein B0H17DRAFT_1130339 [Mycena rosella]